MKKFYIIAVTCICLSCSISTVKQTKVDELDTKVNSLLEQMTLEEKIAELTQDAPPNKRLGIPMMQYSECLHGLWLPGATVYPQSIALGSTWDPKAIHDMTTAIAKEARAANLTHCYSPNLDVISGDPRYGRVEESYGEDPYLVSRMGVAFIEGLQGKGDEQFDENHILATAKHFVGYPENRTGINGGFSDISKRRLYEVFLPPFEAAVKEAGVGSIMPGHQDLNGVPCHMNNWLLNDILRKDWGFDGFLVSDNNDVSRLNHMHFIAKNRTEAAVLGLKSGVDMDLVIGKAPENSAYIMSVLSDTLNSNPDLIKYVDQSVARILKMKYRLGLFNQDSTDVVKPIVSTEESQELALELAKKSVVLLKNENNLLPLDVKNIKSIAVIGPNAHEEVKEGQRYTLLGGYAGIPPYYTSLLEGIKDKVGSDVKVNYAEGCNLMSNSKIGFAKAIKAAQNSDVVILAVGGSTKTCGEGKDRSSIDLYGVQNELVEAIYKTGKPVVAVLINGRPLAINYLAENVPSIIESWYLGMRSGDALADVIFGDYNPGGKLTVTFPRSVGQLPSTYLLRPDFVGTGKGHYKFSDKSPLYHFGYGLSYTTFEYSQPKLDDVVINPQGATYVSVDVTNTGEIDGEEVVQMYVRDDFASVGRYNKMLKGFERVTIKAGETKTVTFKLNEEDLSIYNQEMKKVVEPGTFTIYVGSSSRESDLKTVTLEVNDRIVM
ncbi:glycoside hydrolase family 3 C-terminal domain-containing protein [Flammeovirga yaeyamensis]|uniref:Glycoside hydrolase family 3 C-terminal domain-containing protein n=1 Tax=Flammeovirga yaeyamensis TaxID=367791 RepID=A0AAX1NEZ5_9BACT|nr:beta-xylosidase [Flammeovirga yaeyamensis]MBB3696638.1 beta-glucosidase [Flammeovirga yaeyamensis]NMF33311.1 glycosyl hydrolase [Flammeovirga yaeyamensis]QWG05411.1 glycoside hydrolase family 3 C-terminal domain-containing protein [Flammeovirga yaeyamensis]